MAQDIIGRAWIGVGVRDETRQAISQMRNTLSSVLRDTANQATVALRPLDNAINRVARGGGTGRGGGGGGFGAGRPGGREFGSFGGWNQLAFGLEDAVVSYQLNGFAGATRAISNNITSAALAFGGLKAQLVATAVVVAAQLLPAFAAWVSGAAQIEKRMETIARIAKNMRADLQQKLEFGQMADRIREIDSPDAGLARIRELDRKRDELNNVSRPALQAELDNFNQLREGILAKLADQGAGGTAGDFVADLFGRGLLDQLGGVEREIAARQKLIDQINAQSDAVAKERVQTNQRIEKLRGWETMREGRKGLAGNLPGLLGDLYGMLPGQQGMLFSGRERNRTLSKLFGQAGIDSGTLLQDLTTLDHMRARPGFSGLPSTLSQFSIEGARQFETNRREQYDPQVRELKELQRKASSIIERLNDILAEVRGPLE